MKKTLITICMVLLLSGCSQIQETVEQNDSQVVTSADSLGSTYYPVVQFDAYTGRNEYYNNYNQSSDWQKVGRDLEYLSTDYFSTNNHYMAEGQLLTQSDSYSDLLLWASDSNTYTLQPAQDDIIEGYTSVIMTSSVYELDFYQKNDDSYDLVGLSFSIILDPLTKTEEGTYESITGGLTDAYILEYATQATETLYSYIQNDATFSEYTSLPILICVYQANDSSSSWYSGAYILETYSEENVLGTSNEVSFQEVVFTSTDAETIDPELSNSISLMKTNLKSVSLESVGVVAYGMYYDETLTSFTIKVTANVRTYVELEYCIGVLASEMNDIELNIDYTAMVYSQDSLEAMIVKDVNQDAKTYILGY